MKAWGAVAQENGWRNIAFHLLIWPRIFQLLNASRRQATQIVFMSSLSLARGMECFLIAGLTQRLWTRDIQIHHNRILPASYDYCLTRHVWAGIDFLVGYERRNVDEISRVGLIAELQPITPSHACTTSDDIDHCFQFSMMVGASFGVRLDHYSTCPQLTCPSTRMRDSCGPCHSRSLRCI